MKTFDFTAKTKNGIYIRTGTVYADNESEAVQKVKELVASEMSITLKAFDIPYSDADSWADAGSGRASHSPSSASGSGSGSGS